MKTNPDRVAPNVHKVQTGRRIIKNSLVNYMATAFDATTNLVIIGMLTRYLGAGIFGQYAYIVAIAAIFKVMSGMGVPAIVVREIAKDKENAEKIYASAFLLHCFLAVITLLIMTLSIKLVSTFDGVRLAATLCAFAVVLELFSKLFSAIFQAYEKMEYNAYQTIFAQSISVIAMVFVLTYGYGLTGVFIALLIAFASECVFGFYMVRRKFLRLKLRGNCGKWKYLLKEAYSIGIKRVMRKLNYRIDTIILASLKSSVEVGLFHGVYKLIQSLMFLAEGATAAIFPLFSRYAASSKESLERGYEKSFKFLLLVGLPFGIFFSYFSKPVITLILGKAFVDATPVLQIFGWVLALMFLSNLMEKMLIVGNKQAFTMFATIVSLCVNIALDFALIPKMSCIGASFATLVSEVVMCSLMFFCVSKYVCRVNVFKVAFKPVLACITTCVLLFFICHIKLYLAVCSAILVYVIILYVTKIFTREEIATFKQLLRKRKPILD